MLRDTTQRTFFSLLPKAAIRRFNQTDNHLTLVNGSEILFRSLDNPDRVRGLNLAWFWLDEAPLCGYYAWQVLKGRLRQKGFTPQGWATGTPHGKDGFWRDFEGRRLDGHTLYRASTLENASNLPPGYVESLGYEGSFYDQEVLGLFTAFEGLVYALNSEPESADTHLRDANGREFAQVIGGIDWGFTNPCVLLPFGVDGDKRAWQLDEFYARRASLHDAVLPRLVEMSKRYGVTTWYAGPDEPEHIQDAQKALDDAYSASQHDARKQAADERLSDEERAAILSAAMKPCQVVAADNSIRAGIQTVSRLLAKRDDGTRGLYVAPHCVNTIAEYGSYQYATAEASERNPDEKPLKQNDHAMDAARYCLHSALGQPQHEWGFIDW